ncbi:hypothetical protein HGI30_22365 [Paenibacillus albicereus]|uniref:Uncharacterized protein n=1 Tax=Paenibacillus albicereus TaxID=2726185 RepID=A0A6H2H3J6_9BACL|nr:hypothetical protein [Paenibacillus albicereus]QJC53996.1 hypothetical protein HGI30_22365 [Paenibacillus albicereus]
MRKQRSGARAGSYGWARRTAIGAGAVAAAMAITAGAAYADVDLKSKIMAWAGMQADAAVTELDRAIQDETALQAERLQQQLRSDLERQAAEFERFSAELQAAKRQEIADYAQSLLASRSFDSEEQKRAYASRLDAVTASALASLSGVDVPAASPPPTVSGDTYEGGEAP